MDLERDLGSVGPRARAGWAAMLLFVLAAATCWFADGALAAPGARAVSAGGYHSCAVRADDSAVCWGADDHGQATVPASVGAVAQLAAGGEHTCAVRTDGTPVCWGADGDGQATVPGSVGSVTRVAAGGAHTCAIRTDGTPVCWGQDDDGQATVPGGVGTVTRIAAGDAHTCAIQAGGTPVCWGDDSEGQSTVPDGIGAVTDITAGAAYTCAIQAGGTPMCWGFDGNGKIVVPAGIGAVSQLAAGAFHVCALTVGSGAPLCWGYDSGSGQTAIPAGIGTVTRIATGGWHTCAIKADGGLACWGAGHSGQLGGAPAITSGPPPARVAGGPFTHTYVAGPPSSPAVARLAARFAVSGGTLPPGLTLDGETGVLAGVPTADGTYTGTVTATNGLFGPDATQAFSITVDTAPPATPPEEPPTTPGPPGDPGPSEPPTSREPPGRPKPPTPPKDGPPARVAPRVTVGRTMPSRVRAARTGRVVLAGLVARCGTGPCTARMAITVRSTFLGTARAKLATGRAAAFSVRLSAAGRRALATRGRLAVRTTVTVIGPADLPPAKRTVALTLLAPRR